MKWILLILMFLTGLASAEADSVLYRIKMAGNSYSARLVGVSGTRTQTDTVIGVYSSAFGAHEFKVINGGQYKLQYDSNGGSNYNTDAGWGGDFGKVVSGTDDIDLYGAVLDHKVITSYVATGFPNSGTKYTSIFTSKDAINFTKIKDNATGGVLGAPSLTKYKNTWYLTGGRAVTLSKSFEIWKSYDLQNWVFVDSVSWWDQSKYPTGVTKVYAPRWFIDDDGSIHIIVTLAAYSSSDFRLMEIHPLDDTFTEWSEPVYITGNWPRSLIDGQVIKAHGKYYMYYAEIDADYIEKAEADYLTGPYTVTGAGNWAGWGDSLEGPGMTQIDDSTFIFTGDRFDVNPYSTYWSRSIDTMKTWTPLVAINITDHRNLTSFKVRTDVINGYTADVKDVQARIPRNRPLPKQGAQYVIPGKSGGVDTLAIYTGDRWSNYASSTTNPEDSLWLSKDSTDVMLHLTFEGDDVDDAKGHPVTANNGPTYVKGSWRTTAIKLDGVNDYLSIPAANAEDLIFAEDTTGTDSSFTVGFIYRAVSGNLYDVIQKRQGLSGWQIQLNKTTDTHGFFLGDGSNWDLSTGAFVDTTRYFLAHHVFDATKDSVYIYVESYYGAISYGPDYMSSSIGDKTSTADVYIGRFSSLYARLELDEIIVWSGVRSATEIRKDFERWQLKRGLQY